MRRFPNLQVVSIEFPIDWEDWDEHWDLLVEGETSEQVLEAEARQGWRSLMARSIDALCQSGSAHFGTLELRKLVPKEVSTFSSDAFHHFLSTVRNFKISIRDYDNGAGWTMNTTEEFANFANKLGVYFFDHLPSATTFVLEADESGPLGLEPGRWHAHLALQRSQMPLLKILALRYIFVCRELTDFLVAHADTLEEVVMTDCLACNSPLVDDVNTENDGMRWHEMFNAFADSSPSRLKRLDILSTKEIDVEYKTRYPYTEDDDEDEGGDVVKVREELAENPKRRLFTYVDLDDKYGTLMEDYKQVREAFLSGNDQRAYDRLVSIVEKNTAPVSVY